MRIIIFSIILTLAILANFTITCLYHIAFKAVPTQNTVISKYFKNNKCVSPYAVKEKQKQLMVKVAVSGNYKLLEKMTQLNYDIHRVFARHGHVRPFSFARIYTDFAYPIKYDSMHAILKHQLFYNTLYQLYGKGKIILPKENNAANLFPIFIKIYTYLKVAYSDRYDKIISKQQEAYLKRFKHTSKTLNFINDCGRKRYLLIVTHDFSAPSSRGETLYLLQGQSYNYIVPKNVLKGMPT